MSADDFPGADVPAEQVMGDAAEPDGPLAPDERGLGIFARLSQHCGLDLVSEYLRGLRGERVPVPPPSVAIVSVTDRPAGLTLQRPRYVSNHRE